MVRNCLATVVDQWAEGRDLVMSRSRGDPSATDPAWSPNWQRGCDAICVLPFCEAPDASSAIRAPSVTPITPKMKE